MSWIRVPYRYSQGEDMGPDHAGSIGTGLALCPAGRVVWRVGRGKQARPNP